MGANKAVAKGKRRSTTKSVHKGTTVHSLSNVTEISDDDSVSEEDTDLHEDEDALLQRLVAMKSTSAVSKPPQDRPSQLLSSEKVLEQDKTETDHTTWKTQNARPRTTCEKYGKPDMAEEYLTICKQAAAGCIECKSTDHRVWECSRLANLPDRLDGIEEAFSQRDWYRLFHIIRSRACLTCGSLTHWTKCCPKLGFIGSSEQNIIREARELHKDGQIKAAKELLEDLKRESLSDGEDGVCIVCDKQHSTAHCPDISFIGDDLAFVSYCMKGEQKAEARQFISFCRKFDEQCAGCGSPSHRLWDCPSMRDKLPPGLLSDIQDYHEKGKWYLMFRHTRSFACYSCGQMDHKAYNCPKELQRQEGLHKKYTRQSAHQEGVKVLGGSEEEVSGGDGGFSEGSWDCKIPAYRPHSWSPENAPPPSEEQLDGWAQSMTISCSDQPVRVDGYTEPVDHDAVSNGGEDQPHMYFAQFPGHGGPRCTSTDREESTPCDFSADASRQNPCPQPDYALHDGQYRDNDPLRAVLPQRNVSLSNPEQQPLYDQQNTLPFDPSMGMAASKHAHWFAMSSPDPRWCKEGPSADVAAHVPHSGPSAPVSMGPDSNAPDLALSGDAYTSQLKHPVRSGWVDAPQHLNCQFGNVPADASCHRYSEQEQPDRGHYSVHLSAPFASASVPLLHLQPSHGPFASSSAEPQSGADMEAPAYGDGFMPACGDAGAEQLRVPLHQECGGAHQLVTHSQPGDVPYIHGLDGTQHPGPDATQQGGCGMPAISQVNQNDRGGHDEEPPAQPRHFFVGASGDLYVQWDHEPVPRIVCGVCSMEGHRWTSCCQLDRLGAEDRAAIGLYATGNISAIAARELVSLATLIGSQCALCDKIWGHNYGHKTYQCPMWQQLPMDLQEKARYEEKRFCMFGLRAVLRMAGQLLQERRAVNDFDVYHAPLLVIDDPPPGPQEGTEPLPQALTPPPGDGDGPVDHKGPCAAPSEEHSLSHVASGPSLAIEGMRMAIVPGTQPESAPPQHADAVLLPMVSTIPAGATTAQPASLLPAVPTCQDNPHQEDLAYDGRNHSKHRPLVDHNQDDDRVQAGAKTLEQGFSGGHTHAEDGIQGECQQEVRKVPGKRQEERSVPDGFPENQRSGNDHFAHEVCDHCGGEHILRYCPAVRHLPPEILGRFHAMCSEGQRQQMLDMLKCWWPCPACHSLEHSLDRCPNINLGDLWSEAAWEVARLYQAGRIEEAEVTAGLTYLKSCYKCGGPGHRLEDCPDLDAGRRSWILESLLNGQWGRLRKNFYLLQCCHCQGSHGTYECWTLMKDVPEDLAKHIVSLYEKGKSRAARSLLRTYKLASGQCIHCHKTSHRVPDCPDLANLPLVDKNNLRAAQHHGDAVSLHQILVQVSCCLCKTSSHRINTCPKLARLPDHLRNPLRAAAVRGELDYVSKRMEVLDQATGKNPPETACAARPAQLLDPPPGSGLSDDRCVENRQGMLQSGQGLLEYPPLAEGLAQSKSAAPSLPLGRTAPTSRPVHPGPVVNEAGSDRAGTRSASVQPASAHEGKGSRNGPGGKHSTSVGRSQGMGSDSGQAAPAGRSMRDVIMSGIHPKSAPIVVDAMFKPRNATQPAGALRTSGHLPSGQTAAWPGVVQETAVKACGSSQLSYAASVRQRPKAVDETYAGAPGLRNDTGQHNCFLNAVLQCLWNCAAFRRGALVLPVNQGDDIAKAFTLLFHDFKRADDAAAQPGVRATPTVVDPNNLREALTKRGFIKGEMYDAGELLTCLYRSLQEVTGGAELIKHCFSTSLREEINCSKCKKTTHKMSYMQDFHLVPAKALAEGARLANLANEDASCGTLLYRAWQERVQKSCVEEEGGCGAPNDVSISLEESPDVLTFLFVWGSATEPASLIAEVVETLTEEVDVSHLDEVGGSLSCRYRARGMACFYGGHYVAFIRKNLSWSLCDDARVSPIGDWAAVQRRSIAGALQPSLLLFEKVS